jgi:PAS domain S-box-containing protein
MTGSKKADYPKLAGQLLFYTYILGIACLYIAPIDTVFEPPFLLPVTNTIFTAIIPLVVALIAARAFLRNGSLSLFLMGCGMLSFGICAAFAGWLIRAHDGPNLNVTIYNSGALLGSLFHIFGAALGTFSGSPTWERGRGKTIVTVAYAGIAFLVILFTLATLQGVVPTFFVQGSGPTALRQLVLGLSIFFYSLSSLLFMHQYLRSKQDFLYWYTLCLAMLALGLLAFYIQHQVGGLIGWAGRTSNYVGAIFAAVAVRSAFQRAKSKHLTLEDVISGYFTDAEANFRSLVDAATDAIVSYDQENRIILWNSGAEKMLGYTKREAVGFSFERIVPLECSSALDKLMTDTGSAPAGEPDSSGTIEINVKKKDGNLLPVEISAFSRIAPSGSVNTCILRDISVRKRAEESLLESEKKLRLFVEHAPAAIAMFNTQMRYMAVSRRWLADYGLTGEDVLGRNLYEVFPEIPERWKDIHRRCLAGAVEMVEEDLFEREDGRIQWLRWEIHPWESTSGLVGGIMIFTEDITERKKAEDALREKERRYRSLFEHMLDGYALCKMLFENGTPQDFVYLDVNDSFKKLTGLQDVVGKKVSEVIPGISESNPEMIRIYGRVSSTGLPERFEMYVKPLGIWFSVSAYSLERGYFVSVFDNITERKLTEQTLRASEAKYRDLVESANSIIIRWKPGGEITFINRFALSFFGYREDEILGRNVMALVPERDSLGQDLSRLTELIVENPEQFTSNENENVLSDGRRVWVQWTNRANFDEEGGVKEILAVGNDITALKHAEQERKRNEARFRLLSDTAGRLLVAEDPQGLIHDLCQDVMKHLDCQVFINFMVDKDTKRLQLTACAGVSGEEVRKLERLDYGVAVCGCFARDGVRIIAEDIFHIPDARTELIKSYGIQAYCCHPLKAQDRLIGTLSFGTKTRAHFTTDEVELMRMIADQVSIAMQRVQAEHDLRLSEQSLQLANEHLEQRVRERTLDLQSLTEELEKSRDELRNLASELVLAEERERKRVASVLHDDIAQTLAVARMRVDMLQKMAADEQSRKTVREAKDFLVQSIRETRALMNDLGNPLLFDIGVAAACESLADRLMASHPIQIRCDIRESFKNLEPEAKVILFQVVRELLNNVIKHSSARNAEILIRRDDGQIQATVKDDGMGFDPQKLGAPTAEGGFGLFSIRERLMAFNGAMCIESTPETGTVITASLPARLGRTLGDGSKTSE